MRKAVVAWAMACTLGVGGRAVLERVLGGYAEAAALGLAGLALLATSQALAARRAVEQPVAGSRAA